MKMSEVIIWGKPQVNTTGRIRVSTEEKTVESNMLEERDLLILNRVVRIIDFPVWWPN